MSHSFTQTGQHCAALNIILSVWYEIKPLGRMAKKTGHVMLLLVGCFSVNLPIGGYLCLF